MERPTTSSGHTWEVRRRWIPHRRGIGVRARFSRARLRRRAKGLGDSADVLAEGCGSELVIGVAIVVGVVIFVLIGWPVLVLLADFVWLVVVVVAGVLGRALFGRPWRVEAVRDDGVRHTWNVVGFRAAGRRRDDVAEDLTHGAPRSILFADSVEDRLPT